eukprot:6213762-Pleurochrysis_carterae.AAC.6
MRSASSQSSCGAARPTSPSIGVASAAPKPSTRAGAVGETIASHLATARATAPYPAAPARASSVHHTAWLPPRARLAATRAAAVRSGAPASAMPPATATTTSTSSAPYADIPAALTAATAAATVDTVRLLPCRVGPSPPAGAANKPPSVGVHSAPHGAALPLDRTTSAARLLSPLTRGAAAVAAAAASGRNAAAKAAPASFACTSSGAGALAFSGRVASAGGAVAPSVRAPATRPSPCPLVSWYARASADVGCASGAS